MDVTARPVTASGSRVYDGTTTVNGTNLTSISNLAGADTLSITGAGTATANVGNGKSVTLGSLALASGSGNASNYSLSSATVNITPRPLDLEASRFMMEQQQLMDLTFQPLIILLVVRRCQL